MKVALLREALLPSQPSRRPSRNGNGQPAGQKHITMRAMRQRTEPDARLRQGRPAFLRQLRESIAR